MPKFFIFWNLDMILGRVTQPSSSTNWNRLKNMGIVTNKRMIEKSKYEQKVKRLKDGLINKEMEIQ